MMTDTLTWTSPFGWIVNLADILFLKAHMRRFLNERDSNLKQIAESANG